MSYKVIGKCIAGQESNKVATEQAEGGAKERADQHGILSKPREEEMRHSMIDEPEEDAMLKAELAEAMV